MRIYLVGFSKKQAGISKVPFFLVTLAPYLDPFLACRTPDLGGQFQGPRPERSIAFWALVPLDIALVLFRSRKYPEYHGTHSEMVLKTEYNTFNVDGKVNQ